jgi:hypothetical protein
VPRLLSLILKVGLAIGVLALVIWNGLVDESFIKDDPVAKLFLLAGTGLLVLTDSLYNAIATFISKGRRQRQDEIRIAMLPVLRLIARTHGLDITMLGASVFVARRRLFWAYLKRVDRYRMSDLPQESKVAWNRGKGAIGRAWRDSRIEYVDWRPIHARWGNGKVKTLADWARVPEADRYGFDFHEFTNIVDKYAEILAIPMLKNGKVRGVCAIDVPLRAHAPASALSDDLIIEMAAEATGVIQNVIGKG